MRFNVYKNILYDSSDNNRTIKVNHIYIISHPVF